MVERYRSYSAKMIEHLGALDTIVDPGDELLGFRIATEHQDIAFDFGDGVGRSENLSRNYRCTFHDSIEWTYRASGCWRDLWKEYRRRRPESVAQLFDVGFAERSLAVHNFRNGTFGSEQRDKITLPEPILFDQFR
jgi:hypothetical protein